VSALISGSSGLVSKAAAVPPDAVNCATASISACWSSSTPAPGVTTIAAIPSPGSAATGMWRIAVAWNASFPGSCDRMTRSTGGEQRVELRRPHVALQEGDVRAVARVEREAPGRLCPQPRVLGGRARERGRGRLDENVDRRQVGHRAASSVRSSRRRCRRPSSIPSPAAR
jgi:hypothetical protein